MKTRAEIIAAWSALLDDAEPLVEKSLMLSEMLALIDSTGNKMSDSWQAPVRAMYSMPPMTITEGERFAVSAAPLGGFAGKAHHIATAVNGVYQFFLPPNGTLITCTDSPGRMYIMVYGELQLVRVPKDQLYRLTGTSAISSTSLMEVDSLSARAVIGNRYRVECVLMVQCSSAAHGLKVGLLGPTCTAMAITARVPDTPTSEVVGHAGAYGLVAASAGTPTAGVPFQVVITATIWSPTSTDMITPVVATNDAGSPITLLPGSSLSLIDITD